ncbi:MAG: F0F1 ATP synthase subunit epsilon [Oceanicola sp.]|jgi:F-type H+-transporting ATPase subunit epsilon|nr:F0F1 ATP synthase subunit epsilon [Oceanicola sp.]
MAASMQFNLVSPERSLASLQASAVQIPGADGDLTAMPDHAPVITTLRPGVLTVSGEAGETRYAVTGGFAEITAEGTSVLAERAVPVEDFTADMMAEIMAEAEAVAQGAEGAAADAAAKTLSDLKALGEAVGISA